MCSRRRCCSKFSLRVAASLIALARVLRHPRDVRNATPAPGPLCTMTWRVAIIQPQSSAPCHPHRVRCCVPTGTPARHLAARQMPHGSCTPWTKSAMRNGIAGSNDTVSERLRRWTRNPLGSARRGSNPLAVALRKHKLLTLMCMYRLASVAQR